MADTAVKQLLDTINDLKFKVDDLERRLELIESRADLRETVSLRDVGRRPYWRENTAASAVARHWSYTDLWEAPIIAETEEWATITLTQWPRSAREAAMNAQLEEIRQDLNAYTYTYANAIWWTQTIIDYSAIRNAPNPIIWVRSVPQALVFQRAEWDDLYVPLLVPQWWMM